MVAPRAGGSPGVQGAVQGVVAVLIEASDLSSIMVALNGLRGLSQMVVPLNWSIRLA